MALLDQIDSPLDLRRLPEEQLPALCRELRARIIEVITANGGHLASSLGVVELTVALHTVFESPRDALVWDVGDQAYAHKLLTGRRDRFATIRRPGGLSGFTRRAESEHDVFGAGHASTSISAALGLAEAKRLKGERGRAVAVIGDGGMTGGLAFEALNHAGSLERDLVVVLNDNGMFISDHVGAMSNWFSRKLTGRGFNLARRRVKDLLTGFPRWGDVMLDWMRRGVESSKALLTPGLLFEGLNFQYVGPVDGHDLPALLATLRNVKMLDGPVLVHVRTVKGRGLSCAEHEPTKFHGIGPACPDKREGEAAAPEPKSYTRVFSETLLRLAADDPRLVAVTAAMPDGTGLNAFAERFGDRFYDVGIAEEHAVTFAAGMACEGYRPVVAIYSTFLQRAFDEVLHDVCLQQLPVIFALDRAGVVGDDGPTHHGLFDLSYLGCIPGMTVMAPADEAELARMLRTCLEVDGPVAVRYPRGAGCGVAVPERLTPLTVGRGRLVCEPAGAPDVAILTIGPMLQPALAAAEQLAEREGLRVAVADARFAKPLDRGLVLDLARRAGRLLTAEENALAGGFGQAVGALVQAEGLAARVVNLGVPDRFLPHGSPAGLRAELGLDAGGIARAAARLCQVPALRADRSA
jgi:1-deoxy-D-xylulose-5-phosphate synthase